MFYKINYINQLDSNFNQILIRIRICKQAFKCFVKENDILVKLTLIQTFCNILKNESLS